MFTKTKALALAALRHIHSDFHRYRATAACGGHQVLKTAGTARMRCSWHLAHLWPRKPNSASPLKTDATNVGKLGLAWSAPLVDPGAGGRGGTEGFTLVWNNTIYQPMDNSIVRPDARTGERSGRTMRRSILPRGPAAGLTTVASRSPTARSSWHQRRRRIALDA